MAIQHIRRAALRPVLMSFALAAAMTGMPAGPALAQSNSLVIARDMDINTLDPARAWCDTCQIYNTSVYEQLVTLNADNELVPLLAESWSVNPEQTEFTFTLDAAARFSDGSPVEAKDVKWTFERMKNLKGNGSFLAEPIVSVDTPDARTVIVRVAEPNSEFLNQVAAGFFGVINSDVAAENGALADVTAVDADSADTWFMANSAGSGPFMLSRYEPNVELRLARNENYWRDGSGFDEVVFLQVKDAVAQAQMLQSGTVDIAMQIDPETAASLEGAPVVVERVPSYNYVLVAISPGAKAASVPLTRDVREAISIAIDRESLIDFVLGGAGRPIATPIPLGFPGGDGHEIPEYNPEKSREMLAAAGLGSGFTLEAIFPDLNVFGVDLSLMMQKIQQDLSAVGVTLALSPVPLPIVREYWASGEGIPFGSSYFAPDFYGSSQYVDVFGLSEGTVWANRIGGKTDPSLLNPKSRELMMQALAAPTPEAAEKLWFEAGQLMLNDHIILPMVSPDLILAYQPDISGVRYSACCNLPLAEISR